MVKLKLELNVDTKLYYSLKADFQHSCILKSSESVFYASKTRGFHADDEKFHLFDKHGNPIRTIEPVCEHDPDYINLLPVTINNQECLGVACGGWGDGCRKIWLINLETNEITVAYTGLDVRTMCQGEENTIYTVYRGEISVLDIHGTNFTLKCTLPKVDMFVKKMCYTKEHKLLVLSSGSRVCAMRSSDGQIVWSTSGMEPGGLVYLPQVDVVLAGRSIVEAASGDVVETFKLTNVPGMERELYVHDEQLVVLCYDIHETICAFFHTVSCILFCCIIL